MVTVIMSYLKLHIFMLQIFLHIFPFNDKWWKRLVWQCFQLSLNQSCERIIVIHDDSKSWIRHSKSCNIHELETLRSYSDFCRHRIREHKKQSSQWNKLGRKKAFADSSFHRKRCLHWPLFPVVSLLSAVLPTLPNLLKKLDAMKKINTAFKNVKLLNNPIYFSSFKVGNTVLCV